MSSSERPSKRPRKPTPPAYKPQPGETNSSFVNEFFKHHIAIAENDDEDFKHLELPLARIKKVMKSDPDVKMIASEVPVLFSKACEMFIAELTTRAWMISDDAKRRTLTKADIASAVERGDMFDFLIDIVPRTQELAPFTSKSKKKEGATTSAAQPPVTQPTTNFSQDIPVGHRQGTVDPDIGVYSRENSIPIDEENRLYDAPNIPWQHPFNLADTTSYLDEIGSAVSFDPPEPTNIPTNGSRYHIDSQRPRETG